MEVFILLAIICIVSAVRVGYNLVSDSKKTLTKDVYYDFIECNNFYTMLDLTWTDKHNNRRIAEKVDKLPTELKIQLGKLSSVDIPDRYKYDK